MSRIFSLIRHCDKCKSNTRQFVNQNPPYFHLICDGCQTKQKGVNRGVYGTRCPKCGSDQIWAILFNGTIQVFNCKACNHTDSVGSYPDLFADKPRN